MQILRNAVLASLGLAAAPAAGQTASLSLSAANAYVWRGVTMADQTVLQGDLSVSVPLAGSTFTGGVWTNLEMDPDSTRFSSLTGFRRGVGEVDLYAQLARSLGPATAALGVTALRFPEISDWNTLEVFGSIALSGLPLSPSLVVRKDVDAVGGAYAELALSQALALGPSLPLVLAGVVGASTGQAEDGDLAWYAGEGVTHFGASAATTLSAGAYSITPQISLTRGVDDWARVDGQEARVGAAITVSRSLSLPRAGRVDGASTPARAP